MTITEKNSKRFLLEALEFYFNIFEFQFIEIGINIYHLLTFIYLQENYWFYNQLNNY